MARLQHCRNGNFSLVDVTNSFTHLTSVVAILTVWLASALLLAAAIPMQARAQSFRVLHDFQDADGAVPYGTLAIDGAGHLYGTTLSGGDFQEGVVYQLTPQGTDWVFQMLHSFHGGGEPADGAYPVSGVTVGPDGTLYGTTTFGGWGKDDGTVFKVSRTGDFWQESVIHSFGGWDGAGATGVLTLDRAGNIYGTTPYGGPGNVGIVFELSPSGGDWTETVLASFGEGSSAHPPGTPNSGVIFDSHGNLYGVTPSDSNTDCGTVFELLPSDSGWTRSVLHNFNTQGNGCDPQSGLILDQQGNLYGTTMLFWLGGGYGNAFQLVPGSGSWTMNTIWTSGMDFKFGGAGPTASMIMDPAGNLYGTSYGGGKYGMGVVFKLTPSSDGWVYTTVHEFTGGPDGGLIQAGLVFDANGNLYGAASYGGQHGNGTVFKITP